MRLRKEKLADEKDRTVVIPAIALQALQQGRVLHQTPLVLLHQGIIR